ncbi:methyl-accepting chemotaxis protein [Shewanella sp. NFH-SH190041]|uniref:methyl-accepting chemotaxis protein n=1 Tax=Shewanella sp. NFH-SH190041 TaxID=2950245 RepID=UPI0021C3B64B|nr:methyl-accepting chemotaxis protein [Shewanella sp. NFH-SH190041]BDM64725.1 methyl-accepting chemotaxis protein [Shewanella sp. NFH-SH190041]
MLAFIRNLSISKKITIALFFVIALLLALSLYIYLNSDNMNNKMDSLTGKAIPALRTVDSIYERIADSRRFQLYIFSQTEKRNQFSSEINLITEKYSAADEFVNKYLNYVDNDKEMEYYQGLKQAWENYKQIGLNINELIEQHQFSAAGKKFEESYSLFKPIDDYTTLLYQDNLEQVHQETRSVREAMEHSLYGTFVCIFVLIMLLMVIKFGLGREIGLPLKLITDFIDAIAKGRLDYKINRKVIAENEFGYLADSGIEMQRNLASLVENIANAVARLQSAIEEVSAVAEQSSNGMQSQQSQVTLVASAIEQMRAAVADVASNTEESSTLAHHANQTSQDGAKDISFTLNQIELASAKIDEAGMLVNQLQQETADINIVVDVIRGIAEQTNLLALNAAIEAARAGERGRGFAVVADEVRTLAGRTQNSTGEIIEIIKKLQQSSFSVLNITNESCELIKSCVQQSQQSGERMTDIETQVSQIYRMSEQIASACSEQDVVTKELGKNVERINDSSFEVTEGAAHTAKSCHELAELAAMLQSEVNKFKLV